MGNSTPWQTLRSLVKYHAFYFPLFSFNLTLTIMAKGLVLIHDYVVTIIRQTDNQTDRRAMRRKEIFDTLYHLFRLRSLFHCGSFNLKITEVIKLIVKGFAVNPIIKFIIENTWFNQFLNFHH